MVCDITYLVTSLYFTSTLKVEKVVNFNIYFRDQEEYCNFHFRCKYYEMDTKKKRLKNIFEHDNLSFTKSLQNSYTCTSVINGKKLKLLSPTTLKRKNWNKIFVFQHKAIKFHT